MDERLPQVFQAIARAESRKLDLQLVRQLRPDMSPARRVLAMMTGILIVLVAILVSLYVWGFVWRNIARRTDDLDVPLARDETQQLVEAKFSRMLWKRVTGPGDLNWRRRIIGNQGPVLSMTLKSLPGGTRVEMWMSSWSTQGGVPVGTELIALRRRKLIGLLTARSQLPSQAEYPRPNRKDVV